MEGNHRTQGARRDAARRVVDAVKGWLTASPSHVGYAVVLVVLLLTLPFGGLAAAPEEERTPLPAGTVVDAAPWTWTFEQALWGPDLGGSLAAMDGTDVDHVLLVGTLTSTAETTLPASDLDGSVLVHDVPEPVDSFGNPLEPGELPTLGALYSLEPTAQLMSAVAPGMSYRVGLYLGTTADEVPDQLTVELFTKTYRQSSIDDAMLWTDPASTALVHVPVRRSGPVFSPAWELAP